MSEVRYGTAGWSFEDWYGPFYPAKEISEGPGSLFTGVLDSAPDPDVRLAKRSPLVYYARFFDFVEVNSSFYGIPRVSTTERWSEATERDGGPSFLFSFKLPMPFSHHGDLDPRQVQLFADALEPVRERGRLVAVLAQFPQSFSFRPEARERVARIRDAYPDQPLVAEVRHKSWDCEGGRRLLEDLSISLASIDQPQGRNTLAPSDALTNPELAYVRLHGRNGEAWFNPKAGRDAKYDYLYGQDELNEWAGRIEAFATHAKRTLVVGNNHYRGQAPANVLELRARREPAVSIPEPLRRAYGHLARLAP